MHIVLIVNILIVIILFIILLGLCSKFFGNNKWCRTQGIIKDVIVKEGSYASNDDGRHTINVTTVIEYEVDGKKYTINSASFHGKNVRDVTSKDKIGKKETIIYKEDNPEKGSCLFAWRTAIFVLGALFFSSLICLIILLVLFSNGIINF